MRLFMIGDVSGPADYHLGDEAMLESNLRALRQIAPGIEFTVMSGDPLWTANRYDVQPVARPRIPEGHTAESWMREMVGGEQPGRWAAWLGEEIVDALRPCSGFVVSGGGNLAASWPGKVLERVALVEQSVELGIPSAMVGQTLGPALTPDERHLLSASLPKLSWLGLRDESSAALARDLGVAAERIDQQLDDAFFLDPLAVSDERAEVFRGEGRWIAVTLDASFGFPGRARALTVLASQLDALAESLSASLVFIPNVGGANVPDTESDEVAGKALAAQLRSKLLLLNLWQPREVRWLIERAAMVISTRYHPLVFATAAAVPACGIFGDDYTRTKLRGALGQAGLEGWCIPVAEVERGAFLPLALELWHRRCSVRDGLLRLRADAGPREVRRWEGICRALRIQPRAMPQWTDSTAAPAEPAAHRPLRTSTLSEEQWRQYDEMGYLRLGKVLDSSELAAFQKRMDEIMLGQVQYPTLEMQLDTGGTYEDLPEPVSGHPEATLKYRKVQGLESDPLVLEFIRRDLFREICGRHYGAHASVSIFRIMLMNKPAGQGTYLPWHQDAGDVWKLDRDPLVTTWIALDPATRANGCVQVIPGSHRLGLLSRNGSTLSGEHVQQYCPEEAIEYLELEPGEAVLLHNWLLHRSDINHTNVPRRALSACYMDGRTLNTLTGTRFPIVFGEYQDTASSLTFLQGINEENRKLREMAAEAERYALSLLEDGQRREEMRREAERYAKSLEAELTKIRRPRIFTSAP